MKKQCSKCKRIRAAGCFKKDHRYSKGLFCWCMDCESLYAKSPEVKKRQRKRGRIYRADPINKEKESRRKKQKYAEDPEGFKDRRYKNKYGISLKKFKRTKICLLCKRGVRLVADHNHKTGKYRGALCVTCNLMIAWIERISNSLEKVRKYLERN